MLTTLETQVERSRWQEAQQHEQVFWQRLGNDIRDGASDLQWYDWRARQLERRLEAVGRARTGTVLEVGSGPVGIVNFLTWGERYAIDPLEHFYSTQPSLVSLRRPGVTYIDGTGERLPFDDGTVSVVIIENVIDHTHQPKTTLREIHRALAPDGFLYLSVNVHTAWGAWLHTLLADLRIDKRHPYTFTSGVLRRVLADERFLIVAEEIDDYREAARTDRRSASLKARVKGYTGLSEFLHSVMCRKQEGAARRQS